MTEHEAIEKTKRYFQENGMNFKPINLECTHEEPKHGCTFPYNKYRWKLEYRTEVTLFGETFIDGSVVYVIEPEGAVYISPSL